MSDLNSAELLIVEKLHSRCRNANKIEPYLYKMLRYHDLSNAGSLTFPKFAQAISPVATGISDRMLQAIFERYADGDLLQLKVFSTEFSLGTRRESGEYSQGNGAAPVTSAGPPARSLEGLVERMKVLLFSQGPRGILGLAMAFWEVDTQNVRMVSKGMFTEVMMQFFENSPLELGYPQVDMLFEAFCSVQTPDQLSYDEFLLALKSELNSQRRAAVRKAFRRLDGCSEGLVDFEDMRRSFNAKRHPLVSEKGMPETEMLEEFCETMADLVTFRRGRRTFPMNMVAWEEFEDYYFTIGGCYPSDEMFVTVVERVWDVDKASLPSSRIAAGPAAGVPPPTRVGLHHWQPDTLPHATGYRNVSEEVPLEDVLDKIRSLQYKNGVRFAVSIVRQFVQLDDDLDDLLDQHEFRRACQACGLLLKPEEEAAVFRELAQEMPDPRTGGPTVKLPIGQFFAALHGQMSEYRQGLVEDVWRQLDRSGDGVPPSMLREKMDPAAHPEAGSRKPQQILTDFLDTFSDLMNATGGCSEGRVRQNDWLMYFSVVSSATESDAYFALVLRRCWQQDVRVVQMEAAPSPLAERKAPQHEGPTVYQDAPGIMHSRFSRKVSGAAAPMVSPITRSSIQFNSAVDTEASQVCARIRSIIAPRGLRGWTAWLKKLRQLDTRGDGTIMRLEWQRAHRSLGLGISHDESDAVFKAFDLGLDGRMHIGPFMEGVKGPLNQNRRELVERAYNSVVDANEDAVYCRDLIEQFDYTNYPFYVLGRMTERQAFADFDDTLHFLCPMGKMSRDQFYEFLSLVSATFLDDHEFNIVVTVCLRCQ
mmetsp:Transcript_23081/g.50816  ORF Transcript_23081/g.50816 Transcript_23081/m.50816 type:complete len:817 (+) Transcript_23081:56-2506(+)